MLRQPDDLSHVTMRSDFLPELFAWKALYDIAKQGIDLYAMEVDDLRRAILHPLEQQYPLGDKRFEDALLDKLAGEAAKEASYLPLLQVTLESLWASGPMTCIAMSITHPRNSSRAPRPIAPRSCGSFSTW